VPPMYARSMTYGVTWAVVGTTSVAARIAPKRAFTKLDLPALTCPKISNRSGSEVAARASATVSAVSDERGGGVVASNRCVSNNFRSEEHTSELQSRSDLVCRLLLE